MANLKTSSEASGAPIQSSDLFRIARAGANYKLTTEEIFTETVTRAELVSKVSSSSLIPGRVYKVLNPTVNPLTSLMFVQAVANNQIDSEVVIIVNNLPYPVYYDLANDIFNYINTTYNVFRADLIAGKLIPGMTYRISDYASRNFLNGYNNAFYAFIYNNNSYTQYGPGSGDPNYNATQVYTGDVEPLYVTATAPDKINNIVKSELHPDDIIYYMPYTNKVGVSGTLSGGTVGFNGTCMYIDLPAGKFIDYGQYLEVYLDFDGGNYYTSNVINYVVPGINYKQTSKYGYYNTEFDIETNIEITNNGTRILLKDLDNSNYLDYDLGSLSLYTSSVVSYSNATGYIYYREDPKRNIKFPYDYRNAKFRRFEIDLEDIDPMFASVPLSQKIVYGGVSDNYLGVAGTTGNYKDFPVLFGLDCANIEEKVSDYTSPYFQGNNIYQSTCLDITMEAWVRDNTFIYGIRNFKFSYGSTSNLFIEFSRNCNFNNYAYGNIIVNGISFLNTDSQFSSNLVKNSISYTNIFTTVFNSNKINTFIKNDVTTDITSTDFTLATHVQLDYFCTILNPDVGASNLSYFNGTSYQFVSPTA